MDKIIKSKLLAWVLVFLLFGLMLYINVYSSGKKAEQAKHTKKEIKNSEKQEKTYKKEFDSLQVAYSDLEKKKQKVKTVYLKGKETVKYITKERTEAYTDTLCKKDIIALKNQLSVSDSLILIQDHQLVQKMQQLNLTDKIISEKDNQINLYKNWKQKNKPFGIGIIGGYGTEFQNGLKPFVGVGVSYSVIRF